MNFEKSDDGTSLILTLDKKLSAVTAVELEKILKEKLKGVTNFTVDMSKLVYISSAGLRILLQAQNLINSVHGTMTVKNSLPEVMSIFKTSGFDEILNIEGA